MTPHESTSPNPQIMPPQIVPFVKFPALCQRQLLGADSRQWEALLAYLEATGARSRHVVRSDVHQAAAYRSCGSAAAENNRRQRQERSMPAVVAGGSPFDKAGAAAGEKGCAGVVRPPLTRGKSVPVIGLLRTTTEGVFVCVCGGGCNHGAPFP